MRKLNLKFQALLLIKIMANPLQFMSYSVKKVKKIGQFKRNLRNFVILILIYKIPFQELSYPQLKLYLIQNTYQKNH